MSKNINVRIWVIFLLLFYFYFNAPSYAQSNYLEAKGYLLDLQEKITDFHTYIDSNFKDTIYIDPAYFGWYHNSIMQNFVRTIEELQFRFKYNLDKVTDYDLQKELSDKFKKKIESYPKTALEIANDIINNTKTLYYEDENIMTFDRTSYNRRYEKGREIVYLYTTLVPHDSADNRNIIILISVCGWSELLGEKEIKIKDISKFHFAPIVLSENAKGKKIASIKAKIVGIH
jgi:hypothetical protein